MSSPDAKRSKIAKRFNELKPEDILYFRDFFRTDDEEEANHMILPSGYFTPSGEEIMLRCKRNPTPNRQPWVSRCFYVPSQNPFYGRQPGNWMLSWAAFERTNPYDISKALRTLSNMAVQESWSLSGGTDLGILRNYLIYTFVRLRREDKIAYSDDGRVRYAAFNTGLVDRAYEYIYALFIYNKLGTDCREWQFLGFCVASQDNLGKTLSRLFFPLPKPARYFKPEEPIYYAFNDDLPAKAQLPGYDAEHILVERTSRLPSRFLSKYASQIPGLKDRLDAIAALPREDTFNRARLWREISNLIQSTNSVYLQMKIDLDKAVETAVKRAAWNYRTVIPYYSPKDDTISMLLPISLTSDTTPDAAMVLEPRFTRDANGNRSRTHYMGHTIITLAMAYGNSRLICRPESDWLNMEAVTRTGDTGEDEDENGDSDI